MDCKRIQFVMTTLLIYPVDRSSHRNILAVVVNRDPFSQMSAWHVDSPNSVEINGIKSNKKISYFPVEIKTVSMFRQANNKEIEYMIFNENFARNGPIKTRQNLIETKICISN